MELDSPGQQKRLNLKSLWILVLFLGCAYSGGYSNKCPPEKIKVTPKQEILKTYGFDEGGNYKPNMDCEWLMMANESQKIRLDVMYFDLEEKNEDKECHDYLVIFDGYDERYPKFPVMCGYMKSFSIVSSNMHLYFEFHSDNTVNKKGFKIKYYAVHFSTTSFGIEPDNNRKHDEYPLPTTEAPKKQKNKYVIIGAVFGGVCLIVVIIVIVCLCVSNKGCQCCRNTTTTESSASSAHHERRRRRRRTNRVEQTHSSSSGSFEGLGRHIPPHELYIISPLPPYSAAPPSPPPYSPPYQETELTVFPSTSEFAFFPCTQEFREHRPLPSSPPPSYSSQDLPPNFLNSLYDSHPPNMVYSSQHQCLYRTNT